MATSYCGNGCANTHPAQVNSLKAIPGNTFFYLILLIVSRPDTEEELCRSTGDRQQPATQEKKFKATQKKAEERQEEYRRGAGTMNRPSPLWVYCLFWIRALLHIFNHWCPPSDGPPSKKVRTDYESEPGTFRLSLFRIVLSVIAKKKVVASSSSSAPCEPQMAAKESPAKEKPMKERATKGKPASKSLQGMSTTLLLKKDFSF